MIHIVTAENEFHYRDEMEQAYRLRHRVFVKEMGWRNLSKPDGREIDQFDDKHAVHMLYIENGKVLGYQRFLPSTRPHLLSEIMPQLCEVERPVGAHIWEISRHCVAPNQQFGSGRYASTLVALSVAGWTQPPPVETVLHSFAGGPSDGAFPFSGLIADDHGALYGTTHGGAVGDADQYGTVFKLTPPAKGQAAWKETVLYSFCSLPNCSDGGTVFCASVRYFRGTMRRRG